MRKLSILALFVMALFLGACASNNSSAPSEEEAHPAGWLAVHGSAAAASSGYTDCTGCHGADLKGSGKAVNCFECHSFNTAPPFSIHPASWSDPYLNHRIYAASNGTESCKACHGQDLHGADPAPSCFSASVDGRSCHASGPSAVPHPLDGSFLNPANHGPVAKADLTACQPCHGQDGGPGSNPRFNIGIQAAGGQGCEGCHGQNLAHPAHWAGPNNTFHYSAGSIQKACVLCHGANLDGVAQSGGASVGVSCIGCHDSVATFTLDCTHCHGYPPDGSADIATASGVAHRSVADITGHNVCVNCHGMKEGAPGQFAPTSNYALFDKATNTLGDHWNGKIDMNATTQYNQTNFGCDVAVCHGNNSTHQLSDSGLPVELKDFGLNFN